jgi:RNA polymerase sigma factor (sigma-70 family)
MHQPKSFPDIAEPFSELSARQQEIIRLVCEALSNGEIAKKLGVTEGTVKTHLHAIYEKLGVRSRTELMIALSDRRRGKA